MADNTWSGGGAAQRVRIYVSEEDSVGRVPAYRAIVAFLRRANASGVTVYRGMEGFGASGRAHSSWLAEVPWDLPIVIEWVDTPERVERLLPELKALAPAGMITVDPTELVLFAPRLVRAVSQALPVESVMTRDVATVQRTTPVREVVELMRNRSLRAVPVVDQGRVVGVITSSDVVTRGGLGVRLPLLAGLAPNEQARHVQDLPHAPAERIMTTPPVVVGSHATLSDAANLMLRRKLKRLPVVDEAGILVGIVSRLDLLRTVGDFGERRHDGPMPVGLQGDAPLSSVMRQDVPILYPDSPLNEVVQAVICTRLNRALVVDSQRRVLGMVTARAVLERVTPNLQPTLLRSLMHRLPFVRPSESERHASARKASELMTNNVLKARPDAPLHTVIPMMVHGAHKLIAVVAEDGRLLGVVDRADVLRGIVDDSSQG